jgi:phosphoribosylformylglycinamidine cyclo-ligase
MRPEVMTDLGGFAGLCALPGRYKEPLLVSCTDGVGTKLKLAFMTGRHDTVGIDLVAMSVNDMVVCGAEPLLFLDYFASGKLDVGVAESVIAGIADGCQTAGCALIGGETAELPGSLRRRRVRPGRLLGRRRREEPARRRPRHPRGDRLLGLASSGFHSNGYSLVRRVFLDHMRLPLDAAAARAGRALAQALLRPTKNLRPRAARAARRGSAARGGAHHGGGLVDNPTRMLPADARLKLRIHLDAWTVPPIFGLLARGGDVAEAEMLRTFNMGIGMVVCVPADRAARPRSCCKAAGRTGVLDRRGGAARRP